MLPGTKGVKSRRWNYGVFLLDFSIKNHVINTKFTFFRLVIFGPLFSRIWNFVGTSHLFFLFFLLQNERTNQRTNVIGFGLTLTSLEVQTFLPGPGGGGGGDRKHMNSLWLWCTSHRMKGRETGLSSSPTCSFQPPINHSRPKPPLFKINDGDYQQEKRSLARAPKKNCCVRQAIRWPKCPRLRKVQNENKCCSRKRKINWIYHDNKQSFLFFFSLVHNVLLIFCFIQLHKRLEIITKQTVKQQQKAKLSLFLLITAWFFFYGYWL